MVRRIVSLLILCGFMLSLSSCKNDSKAIKPIKIEFQKEGTLSFFKAVSDSLITTFDIEIADNDYEIQTGLMHRHNMLDNRAMLFIFENIQPRSFYMKNTHIPLDIIYLNKDGIIVSLQENAKPLDETSLPSSLPAKYVLEINAGLVDVFNLSVGDKMKYIKEE